MMRKYTCVLLLTGGGLLLPTNIHAQSIASTSGSWNDPATWAPTTIPTINDDVTINPAVIVLLNVDASCKSLTINIGGTLDLTGHNLLVTTVTTVRGNLVDGDDSPTPIEFDGLVTVQAGGTWNTPGALTASNLIFKSGIFSLGTFNAGGATFTGGPQSIDGACEFLGHVLIDNCTLTNLGNVKVGLSLSGTNSSSQWFQGSNSQLNYEGVNIPMQTGILEAGINQNQFLYDGVGPQNIGVPSGGIYYNLICQGSDKTIQNDISVLSSLTIDANVMVDAGHTFSLGTDLLHPGNLLYSSGAIVGKFKRWINFPAGQSILFPVGLISKANSAAFVFSLGYSPGTVLGEFIASNPGTSGLPVTDGSNSLSNTYSDGYWHFVAGDGFSSINYDLSLTGTSFSAQTVNVGTHILKGSGGTWGVDGSHTSAVGSTAMRSGLTSITNNQFALAQGGPGITTQPVNANVCEGSAASFSLTASGGTLTYHWYKGGSPLSDGGNISGSTTATLNFSTTSPSDNGTYYCLVTDENGSTNSNNVTLNSDPTTVAGTLSGDGSVCSGTNSSSLTLTGYTGSLNWDYSTDGGSSWNSLGNTLSTYTATNLSSNTQYRVNVKSGACGALISNVVQISVDPISVGGTLNGSATVCSGTNSTLLSLTGQIGTITDWEVSTDGGSNWTTFANATANFTATNLTTSTLYHVNVKSGACGSTNSSIASISVDPLSNGGSISGSATICDGTNTGNITLNGITQTVSKWQKRLNAGAWTDISNTGLSYSEVPSATGTWDYQAVIESGVCTSTTSPMATVVVNPNGQVNLPSDQPTVCDGILTSTVNFSTTNSVGTTSYTWDNDRPSIGLPATGSGDIASFTASNAGADPVVATIKVYPHLLNAGKTCDGPDKTFTITVNPKATITSLSSVSICDNISNTYNIISSSTTPAPTYSWTRGIFGGIANAAGSGTGNAITETLDNISTDPVDVHYMITPTVNSCAGNVFDLTVKVNPTAVITSAATANWENNVSNTYTIVSSSTTPSPTYSWSRDAVAGISNPAGSGTGSSITEALQNTTTEPVLVRYVIVPSVNGCTGTSFNLDVTVNPTSKITSPLTANWCNNVSNTYHITSSSSTALFRWSRALVAGISNPASNGTGDDITEILVNTTSEPVVVHYQIIPTVNSFDGEMTDVAVTVNPTSVITSGAADTWCNKTSNTYTITSSSSTATFTWTRAVVPNIVNPLGSGSGNTITETLENSSNGPVDVVYTIVPTVNGCAGTAFNLTVTVNPAVQVNPIADVSLCNNINSAVIAFSTTNTGGASTYTWTNDNTSIGLGASGTGNIPSFLTTNPGNDPIVGNITVIPHYTNGGKICDGSGLTFTITVNPKATVTSVSSISICDNVSNTYNITSSSTTPAPTYSWTRGIFGGIANASGSGTGNAITETLDNISTDPVDVHYMITPTVNSCTGDVFDLTVKVNPTAVITSAATANWENNVSNTYTIVSSSTIPSPTYSWSRDAVAGISNPAGSGTGSSITETLQNTTTEPVVVRYVIVPSVNGCTGTSFNLDVTVNPSSKITSPLTANWCNNVSNTYHITSSSSTAVFRWSRALVAGISNPASNGTGDDITEILVNPTSEPVVVHYQIIPTVNSFDGEMTDVAVTVNPTAVITSGATDTWCNKTSNTYTITSSSSTATFTWTRAVVPNIVNLLGSGSGNIITETLENSSNGPVDVVYTIVPTVNGCAGTAFNLTVTVNPAVQVNPIANVSLCNNINSAVIPFSTTNTGGATTYTWTNDNTSIGLGASGTGNIPSFLTTNPGNDPIVGNIAVTPHYTNAGKTCDGSVQTFTITVNPTAVITSASSFSLCSNISNTYNITSSSSSPTPTYTWNRPFIIGISNPAGSGSGNSITETLVNTSDNPIVVHYFITPTVNGCAGTIKDVSVTINPTATISSSAAESWSNNVSNTYTITSASNTPPPTYSWSRAVVAGITNPAASGTGNTITETLNNTTPDPIIVHYIITPNVNGCDGATFDLSVTVNPTSIITSPTTANWCNNVSNNYHITSSSALALFRWSRAIVAGISNPASNGTGADITETLVNTTAEPIVVHYQIIPTVNAFDGNMTDVAVTVNPTAIVNSSNTATWCNNVLESYGITSLSTLATYNWTRAVVPGISNPLGNGTGDVISETLVNTTNAPVDVTYLIVPSVNGCAGNNFTLTITVNPTADVGQPVDQVVCNNDNTLAVNFTTTRIGGVTTYTWTNDNPGIGLPVSGSGNIASFVAVNNGNAPVVATIVVTPHFNHGGKTCDGPSKTFTITVNPTAEVEQPVNQVVCNGGNTSTVHFTTLNSGGTTTYTWTNNTTSISLAASGSGDIPSFTAINTGTSPVTATIIVTPHFNNGSLTCDGPTKTFTIIVNPTAEVDLPSDQVVCNNGNTTAINFSTVNTGGITSYTWTNDNTSIGLAGFGNGDISSFTAINTGTSPVTATIVVTPHFSNGSISCDGSTKTFTITVNPTAQVDLPINQVICNNGSTSAINFTTINSGGTTTYTWTNNNISIGLAASGNGDIPAFTALNTGTSPITATIVVTPHFSNGSIICDGPTKTFTLTVNPTAEVNQPVNQVICNNGNTTAVNFATINTGGTTTYTWINDNTTIGLPAAGNGDIPSFSAINTGTSPVTATIIVTPHFSNGLVTCDGPTKTFTITVNPTAEVDQPINQVICNNGNTTAINYTTVNTGGTTTYTWSNDNTSIGLPATGNGDIPSFVAINAGTSPVTATITVTPHFSNGSLNCDGLSKTFTIIVNPTAEVDLPLSQMICNNDNTAPVYYSTINTGGTTSYTWVNNNIAIGLAASGVGNIPSFVGTNPGTSPLIATITVTPHFSNGGITCDGPSQIFTFNINPTAQVDQPSNQVICNNNSTSLVVYSTVNTGGTTSYTWTNSNPSIGLSAAGSGNIPSFVCTNPANDLVVATITVIPHFTNGLVTCDGPGKVFTITVNPTPRINVTIADDVKDTVCFNQGVLFKIDSPNKNVIGTVKYVLSRTFNIGDIVNVDTAGIYPLSELDELDIRNVTDIIQPITYTFTPFIENANPGIPCNNGVAVSIKVSLLPEIKYSLTDNSYPGGFNLRCFRDSVGSYIHMNGLKGGRNLVAGYKYLWNNGGTTADLINPGTGYNKTRTYTVDVSDARFGCKISKSITLTQPDSLMVNVDSIRKPRCVYAGPTGAIYTKGVGGVPVYTYLWSNGKTSKENTSITAGTYKITLTDINGCLSDTSIVLGYSNNAQGSMDASYYGEYNVSCPGAKDGSITPDILNVTVISYKWTFPNGDISVNKDITNLGKGKYTLEVIDELGCHWPFEQIIKEPDPITYNKLVSHFPNGFNIQCNGDNNGQISLSNLKGGHNNYEFVWNTAESASIIQGNASQNSLKSGTYHFDVRTLYTNIQTHATGYCVVSDSVKLIEPSKFLVLPNLSATNGFEVACHGENSGSIHLDTVGGYGLKQFNWSTSNGGGIVQGEKDQLHLKAGTYQLIASYGGGICSNTYSYTLKEPLAIGQDSVKSTKNGYNISCAGGMDGSLAVSLKGGVPDYTYTWKTSDGNGLNTSSLYQTALGAGHYTLEVKDKNGCNFSKTYALLQPDSLKLGLRITPISCSNQTNGSMKVLVSGGVPQYEYLWNTATKTDSVFGLSIGKYSVAVKDQNGCSATITDSIKVPFPLQIQPIIKLNHGYSISCNQGNDGSIKLLVSGGTEPYQYFWSGADNGSYRDTGVIDNLHAGIHNVQIRDKNNCLGGASFTLKQPDPLQLTSSKTDLLCFGQPTGKISVSGTGGVSTEPYTYLWSGGQTKPSIDNLYAGEYKVIISDVNLCHDSISIVLNQPDSIRMNADLTPPFCPSSDDGEIRLNATGGTGVFKYSWNNNAGDGPSLINIKSATYIMHVTDGNNCVSVDTFLLPPRYPVCLDIPNAFSPNNDGSNDTWIIKAGDPRYEVELKDMYPKAIIEVFTRWGTMVYRSDAGYSVPWDGTYLGRVLPIDSYYYVITPNNGDTPMKGIVTIVR